MSQTTSFTPDWASPPGSTISAILEERGFSISDFARNINETNETVKKLLTGVISINDKLANNLEILFEIPAEFWLSRELQYRESIRRLSSNKKWIDDFPYADMAEYGWVKPAKNPNQKIANCLEFFNEPTVSDWNRKYEGASKLAAFRTSKTFSSDEAAVLAWLRKGEVDSAQIQTKDWNRESFKQALHEIRTLTRIKQPSDFIPKLRSLCANCGVALVIARTPKGCRASGATRFITPKKAILMLSFRYRSDDHFWFTFFHEAGHLVLHDIKTPLLEGRDLCTGKEEEEANEFAANLLIPPEQRDSMHALPVNAKEVMRFAKAIGVSPGVIVGQLQHAKIFSHKQLNKLKVRYQWTK